MIRTLALSELEVLAPLAREFYASSQHLVQFDFDRFVAIWSQLIPSGMGVIFIAEENGVALGTLGGFAHPELYSGQIVAEEMFWFVASEKRGVGVALYRAFERWAAEQGAASIQMVHLMDSMPEKLGAFYRRLGFGPVEMRYSKRLCS